MGGAHRPVHFSEAKLGEDAGNGAEQPRSAFVKPTKWTQPPELNMEEIIGQPQLLSSPFGFGHSNGNLIYAPRYALPSPLSYYGAGVANETQQDAAANSFYTPLPVSSVSPVTLQPNFPGTPQCPRRPLFPFPAPPGPADHF